MNTRKPRRSRSRVPGSPSTRSARSGRVSGYLLALLAAGCWATGGLLAKWLFTAPSPANAGWPVPPLGLLIETTVLAGARACSAFVLLFFVLASTRRRELRILLRDVPFFAIFGVAGLAM